MTRFFAPFITLGFVVLACSSDKAGDDGTTAGTGATASAGRPGGAGVGGTGGTGGTGGAAAGTTAMGSGGAATGGTSAGSSGKGTTGGTGGTGGAPGSGGVPMMAGSGGATPMAGATGAGAPGGGAGGGAGVGGGAGAGGAAGGVGGQGAGGAAAGAAGSPSGGMAGGSSTASFTCNQVIGIDSTSEWFTGGFENQVDNAKWQIVYFHPGYVQDWENPNDAVYTTAVTSPCAMNSTNPDRVIFNMFADGADTTSTKLTDQATWLAGINKVVATLKAKYSRLKRVDLLTMTRAPNNTACDAGNRSGSVVETYTDDAVAAAVTAGPPQVVASPKFFAANCNIFTDGGPHFTDAGKPIAAKLYGDYYSAEP